MPCRETALQSTAMSMATAMDNSNPLVSLDASGRRRMVSEVLKRIAQRAYGELGTTALAALPLAAARRISANYPDSPGGRGLAVRDVVAVQIETIRPDGNTEPKYEDRRWRPYLILKLCYLDGDSRDDIATRLFIDRGTYNHEQARAIDALAERLAELSASDVSPTLQPQHSLAAPVRRAPPASLQPMIGREAVTEHVIRLLREGQTVALHGLPGAGKTTVLAAIASDEQLKAHFTDGVLWASLGPTGSAQVTLAEWGLALGLTPGQMSELRDLTDLAHAVHNIIGDKRVLLVADDVWDTSTALSLRVGGLNTARLMSTRSPAIAHDIAGLTGDSGAAAPASAAAPSQNLSIGVREVGENVIALTELGSDDSLAVLRSFAPSVIAAYPAEAQTLCNAVGGLPLSLTLIGSRLRHVGHGQQERRITRELAHLQEATARLALAIPEAPHERRAGLPAREATTLEAVIGLSESRLTSEARRALVALSVFPPKPNSFDEASALAVSGVSADALDEIVDAGLVEAIDASRYRLHQAIAEYGRSKLSDVQIRHRFARYFAGGSGPVEDRDFDNCLAALDAAHQLDLHDEFVRGVLALVPLLELRGDYARAETLIAQAADPAPDLSAGQRAKLLTVLGLVQMKRGDYAAARTSTERGLALARHAQESALVAGASQQLGTINSDMADYDVAQKYYAEALRLARNEDDLKRVTEVLFYQAVMHDQQSRFDDAQQCGQEGLTVARRIVHRKFIAAHTGGLGVLLCKRGKLADGITQLHEALALAQDIGFSEGIALFHFVLGYGYNSLEQNDESHAHYEQGLAVARAIGHSRSTIMLQAGLAELLGREGNIAAGLSLCDETIILAQRVGHGHELSFALEQRASVRTLAGQFGDAEADCTEAIAVARRISSAEREAFAMARLAVAYAAQRRFALAAKTGVQSLAILHQIGYRVTEIAEYLVRSRVMRRSTDTADDAETHV